jgi:hypothetical protein
MFFAQIHIQRAQDANTNACRTSCCPVLTKIKIYIQILVASGTRLRSWLRHYATRWKIAGSIPYKVTGFFNLPNPSSRNLPLGSIQPLTETSTRNLPRG